MQDKLNIEQQFEPDNFPKCDYALNCKVLRDYLESCHFDTVKCDDCDWIDTENKYRVCTNCEAYVCEDCEYYSTDMDDYYCKGCITVLNK